jgi:hypothetical protein
MLEPAANDPGSEHAMMLRLVVEATPGLLAPVDSWITGSGWVRAVMHTNTGCEIGPPIQPHPIAVLRYCHRLRGEA